MSIAETLNLNVKCVASLDEALDHIHLHGAGHTEASIDLCKLAGLSPLGVIVEIVDEDGTMARGEKLVEISEKYNLTII